MGFLSDRNFGTHTHTHDQNPCETHGYSHTHAIHYTWLSTTKLIWVCSLAWVYYKWYCTCTHGSADGTLWFYLHPWAALPTLSNLSSSYSSVQYQRHKAEFFHFWTLCSNWLIIHSLFVQLSQKLECSIHIYMLQMILTWSECKCANLSLVEQGDIAHKWAIFGLWFHLWTNDHGMRLQYSVEFQIVCHPFMTVTALMKIFFHQISKQPMTGVKFCPSYQASLTYLSLKTSHKYTKV